MKNLINFVLLSCVLMFLTSCSKVSQYDPFELINNSTSFYYYEYDGEYSEEISIEEYYLENIFTQKWILYSVSNNKYTTASYYFFKSVEGVWIRWNITTDHPIKMGYYEKNNYEFNEKSRIYTWKRKNTDNTFTTITVEMAGSKVLMKFTGDRKVTRYISRFNEDFNLNLPDKYLDYRFV